MDVRPGERKSDFTAPKRADIWGRFQVLALARVQMVDWGCGHVEEGGDAAPNAEGGSSTPSTTSTDTRPLTPSQPKLIV